MYFEFRRREYPTNSTSFPVQYQNRTVEGKKHYLEVPHKGISENDSQCKIFSWKMLFSRSRNISSLFIWRRWERKFGVVKTYRNRIIQTYNIMTVRRMEKFTYYRAWCCCVVYIVCIVWSDFVEEGHWILYTNCSIQKKNKENSLIDIVFPV